ncbi:MAG: hypothetical protein ABSG68_23960 [Thermoguttaceae bacterium]
MRRMPWTVYLWPGLPQLSRYGSWSALLMAVGAAALLNTALLASFVWTELLTRELRIIYWLILAVAWGASGVFSFCWSRGKSREQHRDPRRDLFGDAVCAYLKGNWYETERLLCRLLTNNGRDLEARLMMATLLRRTKRFEEAGRQLDLLVRVDGAQQWVMEIRREGELLRQAREEAAGTAATKGQ